MVNFNIDKLLKAISQLELRNILDGSSWPNATVTKLSHYGRTRYVGQIVQLEDIGEISEDLSKEGFTFQIHFRISPNILREHSFGNDDLIEIWWLYALFKPLSKNVLEKYDCWEDWISQGKIYGEFSDFSDDCFEKIREIYELILTQ